jgi:tryptophanyl-tRNA synthetase
MSKSEDSPLGTIDLLDEPAEIDRKIRRAVTDTGTDVRYDPENRPGLANLLEIFGAVSDRTPVEVAAGYDRYGPLKADLSEALIEALRPVQERYAALVADQAAVTETLAKGAAKAAALAGPTLGRARDSVGLLPRG